MSIATLLHTQSAEFWPKTIRLPRNEPKFWVSSLQNLRFSSTLCFKKKSTLCFQTTVSITALQTYSCNHGHQYTANHISVLVK